MRFNGVFWEVNSTTTVVIIDETRIWSCSFDKTIRVWNILNGVCEQTLEGHTSIVRDMILLLDRRICSISWDGSLRFWDLETRACELTVQVCTYGLIKVIQLQDGRLVISNQSRVVYIIGE